MRPSLALGLSCLAALSLAAGSRTERKSFKLASGASLTVRTANSPITVKGWDKERVDLEVARYEKLVAASRAYQARALPVG